VCFFVLGESKMFKPVASAALLAVSFATIAIQPITAHADKDDHESAKAVYVATNDAYGNKILAYQRQANGSLKFIWAFGTGGRGSGGTVDPLQSQNSILISSNHKTLYAVNAGSGTISVFDIVVDGSLDLREAVHSGGAFPVSLAQNGDTLFVTNASGGSNITGFHIERDGELSPIDGAFAFLSGANVGSSDVSFSPDGLNLVVDERGTNQLDTFSIGAGKVPGTPSFTPSTGKGSFATVITSKGILLNAEAGSGSVSSYTVAGGKLTQVTSSLSTGYKATCWIVASADGKFAYAADAGSGEISVFSIASNGALTLLGATATDMGATPLDLAISADGKFLYALTAGEGTISVFSIASDGSITFLGTQKSIPAKSGQNGIAAL
jgi:6-phosphogluconolactonase (cycloisomerase 2 family)